MAALTSEGLPEPLALAFYFTPHDDQVVQLIILRNRSTFESTACAWTLRPFHSRSERSAERGAYRSAQRLPGAGLGDAGRDGGVAYPEAAAGSYYPCFLEPRRMAEKALTAVIQSVSASRKTLVR
jgi:hypothetical protein